MELNIDGVVVYHHTQCSYILYRCVADLECKVAYMYNPSLAPPAPSQKVRVW